jgi:hypothetical protein
MSIAVSRRNLLLSGAAALVVPSGIYSSEKLMASDAPTVPAPTGMSTSLMNYVFDGLAESSGKIHTKTMGNRDIIHHSNRIRLLARHFESLHIDTHAKSIASDAGSKSSLIANAKKIMQADTPEAENAISRLRMYDPTIQKSTIFNQNNVSDDELSNAIDDVAQNGISKFFYDLSDRLKSYSSSFAVQATVRSAAYNGGAHLLDVDECKAEQKKKAAICFAITTGATLITVGAIAALCIGVTAGACTVFTSMFAYFAYGAIYAFVMALCTLYLVSDPIEAHGGLLSEAI